MFPESYERSLPENYNCITKTFYCCLSLKSHKKNLINLSRGLWSREKLTPGCPMSKLSVHVAAITAQAASNQVWGGRGDLTRFKPEINTGPTRPTTSQSQAAGLTMRTFIGIGNTTRLKGKKPQDFLRPFVSTESRGLGLDSEFLAGFLILLQGPTIEC